MISDLRLRIAESGSPQGARHTAQRGIPLSLPLLLLCTAVPSVAQPPAAGGASRIDPYVPLVEQMELPKEVLVVLAGVHPRWLAEETQGVKVIRAGTEALAGLPGAVRLKSLPPQESGTKPVGTEPALPVGTVAGLPVTSPQSLPEGAELRPVSPKPVTSGGGTTAGVPSPAEQRRALCLERLRQGDQSPELLAWLRSLRKEELGNLIEQTPDWQWEDKRLRKALTAALVEEHGVSSENVEGLPDAAVLALADYYCDKKDLRCVRLYESLLSKIKTKREGPMPELYGLADYHRKTGSLAKAAQSYLRARDYTTSNAALANATVQAARAYVEAGDEQKANELYATVPKYGYGWATGMARWDQAHQLIRQGKHEEARKLLQEPVTGQFADQIKVALLAALAVSYYRTGEFEAARRQAEECLVHYSSLAEPLKGHALESQLAVARVIIEWVSRWTSEKAPLVCEPAEIRIAVSPGKQPLASQSLSLRTFRPIPLTVTSSDPRVKVRGAVNGGERPEDKTWFFERRVVVEISPEATKDSFQATLTVRSPTLPGFERRVPVHVEMATAK